MKNTREPKNLYMNIEYIPNVLYAMYSHMKFGPD